MDTPRICTPDEIPRSVHEVCSKPVQWHIRGALPPAHFKRLCIVGSRDYSGYGKDACEYLIEGLKGYPISIVSGLALGIDAVAHRAALANGIHTIAFPGSSVDEDSIYPRTHRPIAHDIIEQGGCLISGFENGTPPLQHIFPLRNEYMMAWCDAVLIIEGRLKSGTMITATRAVYTNKDVMVIPGSIFSENAAGTHYLLQQGAIPIRTARDILLTLNLIDSSFDFPHDSTAQYRDEATFTDCTDNEIALLKILRTPSSRDTLHTASGLEVIAFNHALALLELKGYIIEKYGLFRRTS